MAQRLLPEVDVYNLAGECWTCLSKGESCDALLPCCSQCVAKGRECAGYHARLAWPTRPQSRARRSRRSLTSLPPPPAFSSLGLPAAENLLLQHYIKNISRIALAVDHAENGFRKLSGMAMNDPGLLNALLALSASHMSRWRNIPDETSSIYLRRALESLQGRFARPALARSEVTLSTMMVLVIYEAFSGGDRWKYHFSGVASWLRARGTHSDISPFLLSWVCMSATQTALHWGTVTMGSFPSTLFDSRSSPTDPNHFIDPIYGCSVQLPRLMIEAAHFREFARKARECDRNSEQEIHSKASALQEQILATKIRLDTAAELSMMTEVGVPLTVSDLANETDALKEAGFAAEVFRHALHVFVYRIVHPPITGSSEEIKASLHAVFELLPLIPDTLGPGSMLGWALVVIGSEVDELEQRGYLRARCDCISLLQLNAGMSGLKVLEEVWRRRDLMKSGKGNDIACGWQEVMDELQVTVVLF